jgi:hypothetical protein
VTSGTAISVASIADPEQIVAGRLISLKGRLAEATLDREVSWKLGCLIQFETTDTLFLGEITATAAGRVSVRIEHSVDLERAAAVRRLWNSDK